MKLVLRLIDSRLNAKLSLGTDEAATEPFLAKLEWTNRNGARCLECGRGATPELALDELERALLDRFGS